MSFGAEKCCVARLNWRLGGFGSGVGFEVGGTRKRGVCMREVRSCDLTRKVRRGRNMIDGRMSRGVLRRQAAQGDVGGAGWLGFRESLRGRNTHI